MRVKKGVYIHIYIYLYTHTLHKKCLMEVSSHSRTHPVFSQITSRRFNLFSWLFRGFFWQRASFGPKYFLYRCHFYKYITCMVFLRIVRFRINSWLLFLLCGWLIFVTGQCHFWSGETFFHKAKPTLNTVALFTDFILGVLPKYLSDIKNLGRGFSEVLTDLAMRG